MSTDDPRDWHAMDDDALLDALGRALVVVDPVPRRVVEAATGAFTWRTIDAELAELAFDSALADAGTRAAATAPRELTFRAGSVEIEVMVVDGRVPAVEGQLIPPGGREVELASPAGVTSVTPDELGRFRFDAVPSGPVRLGVLGANGWVYSDWIVLVTG